LKLISVRVLALAPDAAISAAQTNAVMPTVARWIMVALQANQTPATCAHARARTRQLRDGPNKRWSKEMKRLPMALALPDYTSPCGFGQPRLAAAN